MFEPLGNTTVLPPAQWHKEPQFRGTFGILSSCLITMSLCIWTSLHLNLPEHKKEHLQKYRKLGWMILGLLAPELVVWNAWEQRKRVKELSMYMRERGFMPRRISTWENIQIFFLLKAEDWPEPQAEDVRYKELSHPWTDVHSWLVVMGGIAFEDTSPEDQQFMPRGCQRLPVSLKCWQSITENWPHLVPSISREHIEDKSKSDWLAKSLTCWQAGYFCVQCIFRLSQEFSITLLELNVFAHAICALLLFLVWWDKPRDVNQPILLSGKEALDICALDIFIRCLISVDDQSIFDLEWVLDPQPLENCLHVTHPSTITTSHSCGNTGSNNVLVGPNRQEFFQVQDTYWRLDHLCPPHQQNSDATVEITDRIFQRLVRVYRTIKSMTSLPPVPPLSRQYPYLNRPQGLHRRRKISNWKLTSDDLECLMGGSYGFNELFRDKFGQITAGVTFAGACYGGLHLIAWASAFPSRTEAILWRAASITILATGPSCALIAVLSTSASEALRAMKISILNGPVDWAFTSCLLIWPLWYILCRTFIVVECFILLAHIPESALHVPTWAAYIPSFS